MLHSEIVRCVQQHCLSNQFQITGWERLAERERLYSLVALADRRI